MIRFFFKLTRWLLGAFLANALIAQDSFVAPTFTHVRFKNDRFRFMLEGMPSQGYRLEVSSDLTNWVEQIRSSLPSGRAFYVDSTLNQSQRRFYRAQAIEADADLSPEAAGNSPLDMGDPSEATSATDQSRPRTGPLSIESSSRHVFSNTWPIAIPDHGAAPPYPSALTVEGMTEPPTSIRVILRDISHSHPDDLDILLVSPGGVAVLLMSDAGGGFPLDKVTLSFSDSASIPLSDENLIGPGLYQPTNFDSQDSFLTPAPASPYVGTLAEMKETIPNGTWRLYVMDDQEGDEGIIAGGWSLEIESAHDSPPSISDLLDQSIVGYGSVGPISFNVQDPETPSEKLVVTANSSNPALVPGSNILLAGSGGTRTITLTPLRGQTGMATITVTAQNEKGLVASDSFVLIVKPEPGATSGQTNTFSNPAAIRIPDIGSALPFPSEIPISGISGVITEVKVVLKDVNHTWPEDLRVSLRGPSGESALLMSSVGGGYPVDHVNLTFASAVELGLPDEGQIFSGSFKPTSFQRDSTGLVVEDPPSLYLSEFNGMSPNGTWGLYVIDSDADDSGLIAGGWSLVVVTQPNTPPRVSMGSNELTTREAASASVAVQVEDQQSPPDRLRLSASSSNPAVIPNENIFFSGSGTNRIVTVLPVSGEAGEATITLNVSDDSGATATESFVAKVTSSGSSNAVSLPIELIGADGTTEGVTVNLPSTITTNASLWLQVYGLTYPNKASVQVNNSGWIALSNDNPAVNIAEPGKSFGGIGGGFSVLKMTISLPPRTVTAGPNSVQFRFNFTNGRSSGFRVLKFNFLDSAGQPLLGSTAFVEEDPNTWQPPRNTPEDILEGKIIWYTAQLFAPARSSFPAPGTPLQARCTDCHAQDGRDLKYFNYSNKSIIERAKFHGLNQLQGEQIASYIRSLNLVNPGRPWNPPYQPGPGLDSKPVAYWAAGAGIDWVLDRDADMLPYIFPGGTISADAIRPNKNLSAREVPIAFQLPDWNHWLPAIHPKDAFPSSLFYTPGTGLLSKYNGDIGTPSATQVRKLLKPGDPTSLKSAYYYVLDWLLERQNYTFWQAAGHSESMDEVTSQKFYSLALWQIVKAWELHQEFGLEGMVGPVLFGPQAEPRGWLIARNLFDASPNLCKLPRSGHGINNGAENTFWYFSVAWYHVQLMLNNGNRYPSNLDGQQPIDWGYNYGALNSFPAYMGVPNAMLFYLYQIKALQMFETGLGPEHHNSGGWSFDYSRVNAWVQYSGIWSGLSTSTRNALVEAYLRAWLDKNKQYTAGQYYVTDAADGTALATRQIPMNLPQFYRPTAADVSPLDRMYSLFYGYPLNLKNMGIDTGLQNELLDWCKSIWPPAEWIYINWDSFRPAESTP